MKKRRRRGRLTEDRKRGGRKERKGGERRMKEGREQSGKQR